MMYSTLLDPSRAQTGSERSRSDAPFRIIRIGLASIVKGAHTRRIVGDSSAAVDPVGVRSEGQVDLRSGPASR
jgi:hypothetical protein